MHVLPRFFKISSNSGSRIIISLLLVIEGGLETIGCVDIGVAINCFQKVESNSDADASELLANIEETCPRYYIDSNDIGRFKCSTTYWRVTRRERVKYNLLR